MIGGFFRRFRAARLLRRGVRRRIRVHSVTPQGPRAAEGRPAFLRVAFEFLDPPGPWTLQFYEATAAQPQVAKQLTPGTEAFFLESEDEARTRVLETAGREALWPR